MKFSCTKRVRDQLKKVKSVSEIGFIDQFYNWYVDLFTFKRKKYFLFTNSMSLYVIAIPAGTLKEKKEIENNFKKALLDELVKLDLVGSSIVNVIKNEEIEIGKTKNRSVVGTMVDYRKSIEYVVKYHDPEIDLGEMIMRLNQTPMSLNKKLIFPIRQFVEEFEKIDSL